MDIIKILFDIDLVKGIHSIFLFQIWRYLLIQEETDIKRIYVYIKKEV